MTKLPDCMMPDGAEPCSAYTQLYEKNKILQQERDDYRADSIRLHKEKCDLLYPATVGDRQGAGAVTDEPKQHSSVRADDHEVGQPSPEDVARARELLINTALLIRNPLDPDRMLYRAGTEFDVDGTRALKITAAALSAARADGRAENPLADISQETRKLSANLYDKAFLEGRAEGERAGLERAAQECEPRPGEAWTRSAMWAGELIETRLRALLPPAAQGTKP